jgi:hypothetical protein
MTGQIFHTNHQRGMFSISTTDGSFIVFHLLDSCDISRGDIIKGKITGHGDVILFNETENESFNAYIEQIDATELSARHGCFLG